MSLIIIITVVVGLLFFGGVIVNVLYLRGVELGDSTVDLDIAHYKENAISRARKAAALILAKQAEYTDDLEDDSNTFIYSSQKSNDEKSAKGQREFMELKKNVENLNLRLDNIKYLLSHEVRSPIANLRGLIALLDVESQTKSNVEIIEHIKHSLHELDQMISNVSTSRSEDIAKLKK